ncbi:MAG: porin [Kofleriaceae bacterium]|nr:porin [Kofleriaceae bacterium]
MFVALAPVTAFAQPAEDDLDIPASPTPAPAPPAPVEAVPEPIRPPASPSIPTSPPSAAPVGPSPSPSASLVSLVTDAKLDITGFVQAQGQLDEQSQDQLLQGGSELNQDGFVVRRARVGVGRRWKHAAFNFELDANTVRGAALTLRRAEASLILPNENNAAVPLAELVVGLSDIPFGFEMLESSRVRPFMERTTASLAFFPGEPDIGARVEGGHGPFRYAVALLAGEPINERAGRNRPDPNQAKDLVGRLGVVTRPARRFTVSGGVSLVVGRGFHEGADATKDQIEWRDLNENGAIELGELMSVPGVAATPSMNFERWALGADLQLGFATCLGWTHVIAEVVVASNLDRGLFVADPIATGIDLRHLGAYAGVVQDLGRRAYGGLRVDFYDPNLDAFDARGGSLIPVDETITTFSPLLGARLPYNARASVQYDLVLDNLARDGRGVPTDLANNRVIARLQVDL